MASDLHSTTSDLQWVISVYMLALGAFMVPAGRIGDIFGRQESVNVSTSRGSNTFSASPPTIPRDDSPSRNSPSRGKRQACRRTSTTRTTSTSTFLTVNSPCGPVMRRWLPTQALSSPLRAACPTATATTPNSRAPCPAWSGCRRA
ncbi:MAG: hypothetical protein WCB80_24930 [Mycobacterium sp.]